MRDNAYEKLYEIERKYNVEGIKYDGICLWPFNINFMKKSVQVWSYGVQDTKKMRVNLSDY